MLMRLLRSHLRPYRKVLLWIVVLQAVQTSAALTLPTVNARVIDIWRLVSSIGTRFHAMARRPMADSDALVRLFESNREKVAVEPIIAARLLRALTLSTTHPMLAGEPKSPSELVHLFLHGVGGDA